MLFSVAAFALLATASADYFLRNNYGGLACTGSSTTMASGLGCQPASTTAPLTWAMVKCGTTNVAAPTLSLFTEATCTTPASPASTPITPALSACTAGAALTPASSYVCVTGAYSAPSSGVIMSGFAGTACPVTGSVTSIINYPTGLCGLSGQGGGNASLAYGRAACSGSGGVATTVRRQLARWSAPREQLPPTRPPPPPSPRTRRQTALAWRPRRLQLLQGAL